MLFYIYPIVPYASAFFAQLFNILKSLGETMVLSDQDFEGETESKTGKIWKQEHQKQRRAYLRQPPNIRILPPGITVPDWAYLEWGAVGLYWLTSS